MHPKVVLVVSRTHWRCLSCKLLNRRLVSIDQHLQSSHPQVAVPSTRPAEKTPPFHHVETGLLSTPTQKDLPTTITGLTSTHTQKDLPTTLKDLPTTLKDLPSTLKDLPSTLKDLPTTLKDLPSTLKDLPSTPTEKDLPSTLKDLPSTLKDLPTTLDALPGTQKGLPSAAHPEERPAPSMWPVSCLESCSFSDGELDTAQTKLAFHSSSLLEVRRELDSRGRHQGHRKQLAQSSSKPALSSRKRRSTRRVAQSAARRQRVDRVEEVNLPKRDSDTDCPLDVEEQMDEVESHSGEDESLSAAYRAPRKPRTVETHKQPATATHTKPRNWKGGKKARKLTTNRVTQADTATEDDIALEEKSTSDSRKKSKALDQSVTQTHQDINGESGAVAIKEESLADAFQTKTLIIEDTAVTTKQSQKTRNTNNSKRSSKQIDKSNIATSCVPWLLDSGRKAGEKVTKKSRRPLLPEEKQAVRELYGISKFEPIVNAPEMSHSVAAETNHRYAAAESQSMSAKDTCSAALQAGIMPSGQRVSREKDIMSSHRNYLMGMFPARDVFLDSTRTQENPYPGYGGAYPRLQQQDYVSHTSDLYSSAHNVQPQSRSNVTSVQRPYSQTGPASLSTPGVGEASRHQLVMDSFPGKGFSLPRQSHRAAASQSVTGRPAPPPSSTAVCSLNAATPATPVSHPTTTSPSTLTSFTDPLTHAQKHSVLRTRLGGRVPVDSHPDNQCRVCEATFQTSSEYEQHQNAVGAFTSVECKRCKCSFHGLHELNLHVFGVHETEKQAFCFACDQDTTSMETLERHVHQHAYGSERGLADMTFHDCRFCGEELHSSYSTVRTHYYQHHVAHVCSDCHQAFQDGQAYREHRATHQGRPVLCTICGSKFESVPALDKHAPCPDDIWAEDGKGAQCFKCGLWCPNRAVVEAHRKQHRSQEDVEAYRQGAKLGFPCVSCEKVFKNKHACRRHTKMVHEGVSCYTHYCEYCGKGFLTKGHMRDHIALHHLNIKRYKCDYCDKQFVCGPTLRRHVRKEHTKHRPYQCQHCGERFFEKTPLQRHLTQHTGLAPFMCEHCGKGFYTRHSFNNHASTHSTVKDFVCSGCQKGFTRKYNLQAHIKICKTL